MCIRDRNKRLLESVINLLIGLYELRTGRSYILFFLFFHESDGLFSLFVYLYAPIFEEEDFSFVF